MSTDFKTYTAVTTGSDILLEGTVPCDVELHFMGLSRSSSEAIGVEVSVTIEGITVKLVDDADSEFKNVAVTERIQLPAGTLFRVKTTGVTTGTVGAIIVVDPTIEEGRKLSI